MLMMVFILGCVSAWIELRLIHSVPALQFMERYKLWSICFSIALSYVLGIMFGATGLIAFMAGMVSTVITEAWRYWKRFEQENIKPILTAKKKAENAHMWSKEFGETYKYLIIALKWLLIVAVSPIWIPVLHHRNKKMGLSFSDNIKEFKARQANSKTRIAA